jgi:nucleoside-diphosphate-sugar epimerase
MGPTLAVLCKNAFAKLKKPNSVYAVSRFSDPLAVEFLNANGVEAINADLLREGELESLPDADNVIYMAGMKFGTFGNEVQTWTMNARLPLLTADRYKGKRIVVFSSGNIYPYFALTDGGADEAVPPAPVGDYAASVLARERMFEYAAYTYGSKVALFRLAYAVDLRYGVLSDIAANMLAGKKVPLAVPAFNCIWQKDANEAALRLLPRLNGGVLKINVTGPETVSTKAAALALGKLLNITPTFTEQMGTNALNLDAGLFFAMMGYPSVPAHTLIRWQAEWRLAGGRSLNKQTHFEETGGRF